jgi:hypothetical protein
MQFLPNALSHDIGQRYALGELPQSLVHQCLSVPPLISAIPNLKSC